MTGEIIVWFRLVYRDFTFRDDVKEEKVSLPEETYVSDFRKAVQKKLPNTLRDIDPASLDVWKSRNEIPDPPPAKFNHELDGQKLSPKAKFTKTWPPQNDETYIVIQVPKDKESDADAEGARDKAMDLPNIKGNKNHQAANPLILAEQISKMETPSKGSAPDNFKKYRTTVAENKPGVTFLCNRPLDFEILPIELLHPAFGFFRDIVWARLPDGPAPTLGDRVNARRLSSSMSEIFDSEAQRELAFQAWFRDATGHTLVKSLDPAKPKSKDSSKPRSEGHAFVPGLTFPLALSEGKNEPSGSIADGRNQGCLYVAHIFVLSPDAQESLEFSPLPVILIVYEGPFIQVYGIVMHPNGSYQVQILMPPLALNCDWRSVEEQALIIRFVLALRLSLDMLAKYYKDLKATHADAYSDHILIGNKACLHRSPYPHEYTSTDSKGKIKFRYVSHLHRNRLLFEGIAGTSSGTETPIFVKFTQTYGKDAHELLAQKGMAPKLLGYDDLKGGWKMVVMESLLSDGDGWRMLSSLQPNELGPYREEVKEVMVFLNNAGYVHGDLRACNILVRDRSTPREDEDGNVKFVDFDETGHPDKTVYPPFWNSETVHRPPNAKEGDVLQMGHDLFMFQEIFDRDSVHKPDTSFVRPKLK